MLVLQHYCREFDNIVSVDALSDVGSAHREKAIIVSISQFADKNEQSSNKLNNFS